MFPKFYLLKTPKDPLRQLDPVLGGVPAVEDLPPLAVEGVGVVRRHRVDTPRLADNHRQRLVTPTPSRLRFGTAEFGNPWTQA